MNQKTREDKRALLARFKQATDFPLKVSGVVLEVVPPPMAAWIIAGEVPESLFGSAVAAVQGGPAATAEALKMPEMFDLAVKILYGSCKWPKLTPREDPQAEAAEDEMLNPYRLPIPDLSDVLAWGISGTRTAQVVTSSGEVPAEALHSFREDGGIQSFSENGRPLQVEPSA